MTEKAFQQAFPKAKLFKEREVDSTKQKTWIIEEIRLLSVPYLAVAAFDNEENNKLQLDQLWLWSKKTLSAKEINALLNYIQKDNEENVVFPYAGESYIDYSNFSSDAQAHIIAIEANVADSGKDPSGKFDTYYNSKTGIGQWTTEAHGLGALFFGDFKSWMDLEGDDWASSKPISNVTIGFWR